MTPTLAQLGGSFIAPALAVAGVVCVAVPVVIHLLSRSRRKRAEWGAMRFLRLAYKKQKRRLQLERWLLLAARCLMMVLAGLALAGPLLPEGVWGVSGLAAGGGGRTVHVVVDDSLAGRAEAGGSMQFERLRAMGLGLVDGLGPRDTVQLWGVSGPGGPSEATPSPTRDVAAARSALEGWQPGFGRAALSATLERVAEAVEAEASGGARRPVVAVLSGFSRGLADLERPVSEAVAGLGERAEVVVSPADVGSGNAQVQAVRPQRSLVLVGGDGSASSGRVSVELTLRRFDDVTGAAEASARVRLISPGGELAAEVSRGVSWSAGQATATLSVDLPVDASAVEGGSAGDGWAIEAVLEGAASGSDALAADNRRWATVSLRQQLNVGIVDGETAESAAGGGGFGPGAFVAAALSPRAEGQGFSVATRGLRPTGLSGIDLAELDAVMLLRPDRLTAGSWSALAEFAQRGGLVWVFPPREATDGDWLNLMRSSFELSWELPGGDQPQELEAGPRRLDLDRPVPDALVLLSADWSSLWGPVRFERWVEIAGADEEQVWLSLAGEGSASGGPLLASAAVGGGRVMLMAAAVDPAWTNLGTKPVFPALLHDALRGVLGSGARGGSLAEVGQSPTLGRAFAGAVAVQRDELELAVGPSPAEQGQVEVLSPLREPGLYRARRGGESAVEPGVVLAVNVPAEAGDVRAAEPTQLAAWLAQLGPTTTIDAASPAAVLSEAASPRADWGWALLWLLLGLVLVEMLLARWYSHATVAERGRQVTGGGGRGRAWPRFSLRGKRAAGWLLAALVGGGGLFVAGPAEAGWLDELLGLESVRLSEATAVGWRYPLPAWAWALIVLGAAGSAWWSYRRLLGPVGARVALAALRSLLILLIAVLLAGPQVVRTDETVQEDVLLVLVDRSASMTVADVPAEVDGRPGLVSRDAALREALRQRGALFGEQRLGRGRRVAWLGFGEEAFDLEGESGAAESEAWAGPDEPGTSVRAALEQGLRRAAGRPISGVVLMTDGRSPEPTGRSLLDRLEREAVQVFAVPLGAEELPLDLALVRVEPPTAAFVSDPVPVTVVVEQPGGAGQPVDPARVTVSLIDTQTQDVVDERTLEGVGLGEPLRLEGRSSLAGERSWEVRVRYDDPAGEGELNLANNDESFVVEMIDRPIRVLYVEGYPRWEYRYLKNMLIREQSIESSMFLLSADRTFAQEGDVPITRLPDTAEEWRRYDVVILGDVPAEVLSPEQRQQLHDLVAQRGAGVLFVGGARAMPSAYGGTLLSDLLPMREPEAAAVLPLGSIAVSPTALAESLSVLRLRAPGATDEARPGWPSDLPALRWAQDLGALKPSAEVLATVRAADGSTPGGDGVSDADGGAEPMVARLRYGAGQSLYVATDETWRWRYARGEAYFEQFWVQLVRLLGRAAATRSDAAVRLAVSNRQVPQGGTVVVRLDMEDAALVSRDLPSLRVAVRREAAADGEADAAGEGGQANVAEFELRPSEDPAGDGLKVYTAPLRAETPGRLEVVVTEPALAGLELSAPLEVLAPDDELRRAEADRPRLAELAEATGGRVIELSNLEALAEPGVVRNLARKTANDVAEPIANSALALGLIVGLLALEWVGRKLIRLV